MAAKKTISDEEKTNIIAEHASGILMSLIAKNHDISATMVSYIIHPEKVAVMRQKAKERPTEKAMNIARMRKYRGKK